MATTDAPLDIDAVLFRCVEQELGATDDLGWGRYLARLRIVRSQATIIASRTPRIFRRSACPSSRRCAAFKSELEPLRHPAPPRRSSFSLTRAMSVNASAPPAPRTGRFATVIVNGNLGSKAAISSWTD